MTAFLRDYVRFSGAWGQQGITTSSIQCRRFSTRQGVRAAANGSTGRRAGDSPSGREIAVFPSRSTSASIMPSAARARKRDFPGKRRFVESQATSWESIVLDREPVIRAPRADSLGALTPTTHVVDGHDIGRAPAKGLRPADEALRKTPRRQDVQNVIPGVVRANPALESEEQGRRPSPPAARPSKPKRIEKRRLRPKRPGGFKPTHETQQIPRRSPFNVQTMALAGRGGVRAAPGSRRRMETRREPLGPSKKPTERGLALG